MKYDLHINQRAIIEHGFDLDVVDGAIMDFCRAFSSSPACRFIIENNERYYWFSHKLVCEQLPILRMKPDTAYRRMKALSDKSFLKAHPENKQRSASWYAFGPLADALVSTIGFKSDGIPPTIGFKSEPSDQNPKGIGSESEGPSDQNPMYKNISDKGINQKDDEDAERAGANAGQSSTSTPEKKGPHPPVPAAPPPPAELKLKRSYGDGELYRLVGQYYRENPDNPLPTEMYVEFLEYYTEIIQNSERPSDIGKERWRTYNAWTLHKKIEKWYTNYLKDQKQAHDAGTRNNPINGNHAAPRPAGPKAGNSRPVRRTPLITADKLSRSSEANRHAGTNGDGRTISLDVDGGH